jgi:phage shock protein A
MFLLSCCGSYPAPQPSPASAVNRESDYLNEVRTLVAELKRLNENLEALAKEQARVETKSSPKRKKAAPKKEAEKSAVEVSKHVNTFLKSMRRVSVLAQPVHASVSRSLQRLAYRGG